MNKEEIVYDYKLEDLQDMTNEEILETIKGLEKLYQDWERLYIGLKEKYIERGNQLDKSNNKIEKIKETVAAPIDNMSLDWLSKIILSIIDGSDE